MHRNAMGFSVFHTILPCTFVACWTLNAACFACCWMPRGTRIVSTIDKHTNTHYVGHKLLKLVFRFAMRFAGLITRQTEARAKLALSEVLLALCVVFRCLPIAGLCNVGFNYSFHWLTHSVLLGVMCRRYNSCAKVSEWGVGVECVAYAVNRPTWTLN